MAESKADLRARTQAARDAIPAAHLDALSRRIVSHALELPEYRAARVLSCYVAFRSEVRTLPLIQAALDAGKGVAVPRVDPATWEMDLAEVRNLSALAPGTLGIPEPAEGRIVDPGEVDVHFVPGLAFDRTGGRLGYGRGCYDRLLSGVRAPAFGLAFDVQVVDSLPADAHDVPLAGVVTESRVMRA